MEKLKRKHFLDSKGICFLCLKYKNIKEELESTYKQISLRAIARYLNLDIWKLYCELNSDVEESKDNLKGEVLVNLCKPCSDIIEYCTELYNILEETKLLLNGYIYKILGVMDVGRSDHSSVEEMRSRLIKDQVYCDFKMLEILRKNIMFKCERKLKNQGPRVLLQRLSRPPLKRKVLSDVPPTSPKVAVKIISEDSTENLEVPMEVDHDTNKPWRYLVKANTHNHGDAIEDSLADETDSDPLTAAILKSFWSKSTTQLIARFTTSEDVEMPKRVTSTPLNEGEEEGPPLLNLEESSHTYEHSLGNALDDPLVEETASVTSTLVISKVKDPIITRASTPDICDLEKNSPPEVAVPPEQKVLKSEIEDNIEMSLGSPSNGANEEEEAEPSFGIIVTNTSHDHDPPPNFKSSGSGSAFVTSYSVSDQPFIRKSSGGPVICQYCQKAFNKIRETNLFFHLQACHPEHFFPKLRRLSNLPPPGFNKVVYHFLKKFINNRNCSLCNKQYNIQNSKSQLQCVRNHLFRYHHEVLEEDMIQPQNLPEFMKETNTLNLRLMEKEVPLNPEKKMKICRPSKSGVCPHCSKKILNEYRFKYHIVSLHKDAYFRNMKKPHVTDKQYKMITEHLIFNDLINNMSCKLCPTWKNERSVRMQLMEVKIHLLEKHQHVLAEKLEQIQKDPNLLEEVSEYNFRCQCGLLFRKKEDLQEHKNRCKYIFRKEQVQTSEKCSDCGFRIQKDKLSRHKEQYCPMKKRISKRQLQDIEGRVCKRKV